MNHNAFDPLTPADKKRQLEAVTLVLVCIASLVCGIAYHFLTRAQ